MNNVISVFNRLTQSKLDDITVFENVLDNHYEKFKYFYRIVNSVSLDKISVIECDCPDGDQSLNISIEFAKSADRNTFSSKIEECLSQTCGDFNKYFSIAQFHNTKTSLNILIENKTISREEDVYEDRFNSN